MGQGRWKEMQELFTWLFRAESTLNKQHWKLCHKIVELSIAVVHSLSHASLWSDGLQHARLSWPSLSPRVCSNSCPLRRWCHRTILSSVALFSSSLQSFPASGSFPMSQLWPPLLLVAKVSSASASVLPMNIQGWRPLGLTFLISLQAKGLSRVFSSTTI